MFLSKFIDLSHQVVTDSSMTLEVCWLQLVQDLKI